MLVVNRPVNVVEEGLDVALRVRASLEDSASMVVKRLDVAQQILLASPQYLARKGVPAVAAGFAAARCVVHVCL